VSVAFAPAATVSELLETLKTDRVAPVIEIEVMSAAAVPSFVSVSAALPGTGSVVVIDSEVGSQLNTAPPASGGPLLAEHAASAHGANQQRGDPRLTEQGDRSRV
jgi:hypothetical protein